MNKPNFLRDIFTGGSRQSSNPKKDRKGSKHRRIRLSFCCKRGMQKNTSKQTVVQWSCHGPNDREKIDAFRKFIYLDVPLVGSAPDDHTLLRFLRMRGYDMVKAKEMFLNHLKWREEFHVDSLYKEFKFDEYKEVKRCYPHGFHGVDRDGRPVYIERIGMVDINNLLKLTTVERFVKYHVSEQEKTLNMRFPACSNAARKQIASTTSICDVKGVGLSNFSKPARNLFWKIQKIDSSYYPETLHRLFIINAGSGFMLIWQLIKPFLEQRTLVKIQVLGSNYKNSLFEVIDPSNLPTFLDGDCTCSDYEGCLMSDRGPWNDPKITDALVENIQIKDVYDVTPEREREQLFVHKIQKIEAFINDANAKIQTLEAALKDTKLVLQGLAEHMEDLKKTIQVTNTRG